MHRVFGNSFSVEATLAGQPLAWTARWSGKGHLPEKTAPSPHPLKQLADDLGWQVAMYVEGKQRQAPVLPLIAAYGTGRLWRPLAKKSKSTNDLAPNERRQAYANALSPSTDYAAFSAWFERYSHEEVQEQQSKQESPHQPGRMLDAVRRAVDLALRPAGWSRLSWDFAEQSLRAFHETWGYLPIAMLSDGIRGMIGLVGDIAYRAALLNPQWRAEAVVNTPGIVLIDEVDMHLHPEWQQTVLQSLRDAFPRMQFIVTTHSPQVLSTVRRERIRVLSFDGNVWSATMPDESPLGRPSSDALARVQEVDPRPPLPIQADISEYEQLVRAGREQSAEAVATKQRLDAAGVEIPDPDIAMWRFLAARKQGGASG